MFSPINHHQTCSKTNNNIQLLVENHLHAVLAHMLIDTDIMLNLFSVLLDMCHMIIILAAPNAEWMLGVSSITC
jgi:hypothetical protein